jgi:hypothetical protein
MDTVLLILYILTIILFFVSLFYLDRKDKAILQVTPKPVEPIQPIIISDIDQQVAYLNSCIQNRIRIIQDKYPYCTQNPPKILVYAEDQEIKIVPANYEAVIFQFKQSSQSVHSQVENFFNNSRN